MHNDDPAPPTYRLVRAGRQILDIAGDMHKFGHDTKLEARGWADHKKTGEFRIIAFFFPATTFAGFQTNTFISEK